MLAALLISTRRRTQPAHPFDSLLSLQAAVRGKVHGVGRAGAVGGFLLHGAGAVCHGASLFFLPAVGITNGYELFASIRKGV